MTCRLGDHLHFLFFNLIFLFSALWNKIETEMMKERFAKVLLGEDMSGSGKGVCTAMAISNAITNLYGIFSLPWLFSLEFLFCFFILVICNDFVYFQLPFLGNCGD